MNLRALRLGQRADLAGHATQALDHVRAVIEAAPDVGPVLVAAYRAMSALRELRDVVDELPEICRGDPPR
jgi:hypothetical protein